jgi:hypothetical protein
VAENTSTVSVPLEQPEEWRPVVGYEGLYDVSNRGRVRSLPRVVRGCHGSTQLRRGRILKPRPNMDGYPGVILCHPTKRKRGRTVHILVAAAFIGPRPLGLIINHKDGVKTNCRPDNLEYITQGENVAHAFRTGLDDVGRWQGERHYQAKLKNSDIPIIRSMLADGVIHKAIAERFGVAKRTITDIAKGATWQTVPGPTYRRNRSKAWPGQ